MINRDNYIEYIVDYFDNNLSPQLRQQLLDYLKDNADVMAAFELYKSSLSIELPAPAENPADITRIDKLKTTLKSIPQKQSSIFNKERPAKKIVRLAISLAALAASLILFTILRPTPKPEANLLTTLLTTTTPIPSTDNLATDTEPKKEYATEPIAESATRSTTYAQPAEPVVLKPSAPISTNTKRPATITTTTTRNGQFGTREVIVLTDKIEMPELSAEYNSIKALTETLVACNIQKADIDINIQPIEYNPILKSQFKKIMAPLSFILPVSYIESNTSKGVIIASFIKIERQKPFNYNNLSNTDEEKQ